MRFVIPAVLALVATAQLPTPRPTITPAPESGCNYEDAANGPFALDCLQARFLLRCSMRGTSYPTEVNLDADAGDKGIYNGLTWAGVKTKMDDIADNDKEGCRGPDTPTPTDEPVASPTTRHPTPAPTRIPTTDTPAPTYSEDMAFKELAVNAGGTTTYADAAAAATALKEACVTAGYGRQYDATQYVIKLEMGDFTDYYTFEPVAQEGGTYLSICDLLEDPLAEGIDAKWSADEYGPFMSVDLSTDTQKTPEGRVYPSWLDTRGGNSGGGYGSNDEDDLTTQQGTAYTLSITSMRKFAACVERVDQEAYVSPCTRSGSEGQDWSASATLCDSGDTANLLYSMANMGLATCDDMCVYHPDFESGSTDPQRGQFWYWLKNGSGGCWKPRSDYATGEFQHCDPTETSFEYGDALAFVGEKTARLCSERCDHVNGWRFMNGSCFKVLDNTMYSGETGATNVAKANAACASATGGFLASVTSEADNDAASAMCGNAPCYLGNDADNKGTAAGGWLNGDKLIWSNWKDGYEGSTGSGDDEDFVKMMPDGTWEYTTPDFSYNALCKAPADMDADESGEDTARFCMENGAASKVMETNQFPALDIAASGFTDAAAPGTLHLVVTIPKYFYNAFITFENSTNDAAEYNYAYKNDAVWSETLNTDPNGNVAACEEDVELLGKIDWTVFNLGGAGGVQRLATYETSDGTTVTQTTPDSDLAADGYENSKYLFGSVMRIEATQPVYTEVDVDADTFQQREALFERNVVARIPFILQFQKTVTVTTDVDIISTKFNYKTVAAIIQSVQYDTQFFAPPYASIKLQIRTKSQYPYLFNKDVSSIKLHPVLADTNNDNVDMSIAWLADDANCTFTNPDHMREGDICTQEWMLTLIPDANVCYATGEYSVEYEADCFYGKDVCYLPLDSSGVVINTVTFTFKVQTSKFCPTVADEVDISGTLTVTGRESFKPDEEGVEDNTDGSFYLQGETVKLFATTSSEKAVITATRVEMVEIEQNLDQLVMTGYNRVPYDADILDMTIWTPAGAGRIADGTVTVNDGSGDVSATIMQDSDVFNSGSTFAGHSDFSATEAGFQMTLNAKVFPVNVDSFGSKTVIATLGVDYEALSGLTRRRLLTATRNADLRSRAEFRLDAWKPTLGQGTENVASMQMELTIQESAINRKNVMGFVQSFEDAIVTALKSEASSRVYEDQVVVEAVFSKDSMIWSRPSAAKINRRKLLAGSQKIRVVFSMIKKNGGMPVKDMLKIFDKQLRSPSSPLMVQPIFYGSVVHTCTEVEPIDHVFDEEYDAPAFTSIVSDIAEEESSAVRSLPIFVALISMIAMW